jgi:hypothetical protein
LNIFFSSFDFFLLLKQKGHVRKNWLSRYFVLTQYSLSYYAHQYGDQTPLGVIDLFAECEHVTVERHMRSKKSGGAGLARVAVIKITTPKKRYKIDAGTMQEFEAWFGAIQGVLQRNQQTKRKN